jgi:hypothetical protein
VRGIVVALATLVGTVPSVLAQGPAPVPGAARAAGASEDGPLSIAGYVAALGELRADLEAARLEEARAAAERLSTREVAWGEESLAPDPTLLEGIRRARSAAEARAQAARVRRLVEALGGVGGVAPVTTRPDVLSRISPAPDIERGGEAPRVRLKPLTFPERVEKALLAVADWIGETLRKIGDWLRRLMPDRPERTGGDAATTATVAVAFAAVAAALLVLLAVRTLRHGRGGPTEAIASRAASSSKDEDPLSREANEWEDYARELGARRRWREAIRAWYHAVLVTLFRSGLLHHQRGRTNWEYVSRLSPRLAWRSGFVALTHRFDREWYGRRTSDAAALSEAAREARDVLRAVRGTTETM